MFRGRRVRARPTWPRPWRWPPAGNAVVWRFATTADLVTELIESKERNELGRMVARWSRCELIVRMSGARVRDMKVEVKRPDEFPNSPRNAR